MVARGGALLLTTLALPACAPASDPATPNQGVQVRVDATAPGAPLERVWAFHGYDEINYSTLPEGKALLETLSRAHSAKVHVRNHFLFNSGDGAPQPKWGSTNVYTEDADGNAVYSWSLTDEILDAITQAGALPLVELGFMPEALSVHPAPYQNTGTIGLNGGCFYPPNSFEDWASLVRAWAEHAEERYPDVTRDWLWELWNEPDSAYWHGSFDEYARLYDYTEAALHEALPGAALGGPAVIHADGPFLTQFLEHCASGTNAVTGETGTRLDLVTFHAKGGTRVRDEHVELNLGNQLRLHRAGMQAVVAQPAFAHTPIYITEADPDGCAACTADLVPGAEYRTSTAYGAYVVAMMKRTLELEAELGATLGGVLTWAFTFPGTPLFSGYRELASGGLDLPVLGAFKLLGQLDGARLPLSSDGAHALAEVLDEGVLAEPDIDGLATWNGAAVQVLVWNYHDQLLEVPASPVRLSIRLPRSFGAAARVSHLRVDAQHGDAYTAWVSQGEPESPSAEQLEQLEQAMEPALLAPEQTVAVVDDSVQLDFELPRFGLSLITVSPATADAAEQ